MSLTPRIEELRHRVERDPASIAFAQLAEEYRRIGDCEAAVRVCEAGLARHPAYISARVTLGRALLELGRIEEARAEFARVLEAAPDNLVAVSKLAEIRERSSEGVGSFPLPPDPNASRTTDDRILAQLQAWVDVLTERRMGRRRRS